MIKCLGMVKYFSSHLLYLLVIWILGLSIYFFTRPPFILYVDAGTHIAAAYTLGISNPPGFPTYLMIGHLFTKLPFGTVLFRLQLLSIISAMGVLTLLYFLIYRLLSTNFFFVKEAVEDKKVTLFKKRIFGKINLTNSHIASRLNSLIALAAALALAFSYQFWSQTINTESYILTNLAMISLLVLVLTLSKEGKISFRRILAGSTILGLATGLNPTIVQTLPALSLAAIFLWRRIRLRYLGAALLVILLLVAGVYSYLPLRAREYPFTNWGNPQTWELFWGHVRGEGLDIYDPQTNSINGFTGSPRVWAQSTGRYLFLVLVQFTPVLVPLILLGMYYLFVKNWRLFSVLIAIPSTNLIFGALYLSGNQESWFIASYVIFAIFLGAGMAFCAKIFLAKNLSYRVLSAVILCVSLLPLFWWFPKLNRSHQIVTKEYAENLYRNIPDDGKSVLIGSRDFFNSLSHYMYSVEGKKGIFPVTVNMWYILPWYRDTLRHYRPDLMPQELEGMIKMKEVSEYNRVLNWWIEYLLHKGMRVYITPSVFRETVLAGTNEGRYKVDKTRLRVIPDGLTFRALEAHDILQPGEFDFQFSDPKFYEKPPFYLERNYKAGYNLLLSEYAYAYMALGDEFDSREKTEENVKKAQRYFEKAYLFAPFAEDVVNRLAIFWANHGDLDIAVRYFTEAASLDPSNIDIRLNRAYALLEVGDLAEAEKELQFVMNNAQNQEQAKNALSGFAELNKKKIISQIPNDWKVFEGKKSGILFAYPPDWKVTENGKLVVVKDALGNFEISFFAGDEVVSPIKVSGQIVQEGPAQIPGFEAQARIRQEKEDKQSIEFFLRQGQKNLHILVEPFDARFMPMFDKIISTLRFVAG